MRTEKEIREYLTVLENVHHEEKDVNRFNDGQRMILKWVLE